MAISHSQSKSKNKNKERVHIMAEHCVSLSFQLLENCLTEGGIKRCSYVMLE